MTYAIVAVSVHSCIGSYLNVFGFTVVSHWKVTMQSDPAAIYCCVCCVWGTWTRKTYWLNFIKTS